MNSSLSQILTASDNLSRYIRESGDHASAVLVRKQAGLILDHAQEFAQERADNAGKPRDYAQTRRFMRRRAAPCRAEGSQQ